MEAINAMQILRNNRSKMKLISYLFGVEANDKDKDKDKENWSTR